MRATRCLLSVSVFVVASIAIAYLAAVISGATGLGRVRAATPPAPPSSIVVDGDLADLEAHAQGEAVDPCNEVMPLCRSGFDFVRVLVFYDVEADTLFVGLDVMDVDGGACYGLPGPGVAGDTDGDGDPSADGDIPECDVHRDDFGVGRQEFYLVVVDTDFNGRTTDPCDLLVLYENNRLRFFDGTWKRRPSIQGEIALGMAGAPVDPEIPNGNRVTEDIEIAVRRYSRIDDDPNLFAVDARAGAAFAGLCSDALDQPIVIALAR